MKTVTDVFFALLRNALWGEQLPFESIPHDVFVPLIDLASRQTVCGLVCGALIKNDIRLDREDALKAFVLQKSIAQANNKADAEVINLVNVFDSKGIDYRIFKGQTLSQLYPSPIERQPGDIDFYCNAANYAKAVAVIEHTWNVKVGHEESEQHAEFKHNDVLMEMHFRMIKFENGDIQRYWEELLACDEPVTVNVAGTAVVTLSPTLNVLYTFLHLYHHLVELGVGFRQFCDVACLLHHHRNVIDRAALRRHLHAMSFTHAFAAVGWILVDKLGFPQDDFPITITDKDKSYEPHILKIVFTGGNFGQYAKKTRVRSGLSYYVETLLLKASHYRMLYKLSPKEITSSLLKGVPAQIYKAYRRHR